MANAASLEICSVADDIYEQPTNPAQITPRIAILKLTRESLEADDQGMTDEALEVAVKRAEVVCVDPNRLFSTDPDPDRAVSTFHQPARFGSQENFTVRYPKIRHKPEHLLAHVAVADLATSQRPVGFRSWLEQTQVLSPRKRDELTAVEKRLVWLSYVALAPEARPAEDYPPEEISVMDMLVLRALERRHGRQPIALDPVGANRWLDYFKGLNLQSSGLEQSNVTTPSDQEPLYETPIGLRVEDVTTAILDKKDTETIPKPIPTKELSVKVMTRI